MRTRRRPPTGVTLLGKRCAFTGILCSIRLNLRETLRVRGAVRRWNRWSVVV